MVLSSLPKTGYIIFQMKSTNLILEEVILKIFKFYLSIYCESL